MSQKLDREGIFRANPTQCTLTKSDKGSISWQALFKITEAWVSAGQDEQGNPVEAHWEDWSGYDLEFLGFHRLTKNNGDAMDLNVKALVDSIGWDGNLQSLCADQLDTVQITVGNDTYEGKTRLIIKWLNPADSDPASRGQLKQMDPEEVKALANQFNGKFRALVSPKKPAATPAKAPPPIRK